MCAQKMTLLDSRILGAHSIHIVVTSQHSGRISLFVLVSILIFMPKVVHSRLNRLLTSQV